MTPTLLCSPFAQILPLHNEISRREPGGQVIGLLANQRLGYRHRTHSITCGVMGASFLAISIFILKTIDNHLDFMLVLSIPSWYEKEEDIAMVNNNLIPAYADGYEIRFDRPSDTFRCFQNDVRLKNNGKAFASKSLDRAKKLMAELGAKEVAKKPQLWTPPPAAVIAPLEEQLAALPADAPRFVLIEAPYGGYKERGYACYDRQEQEIVSAHTYNSWNNVTQDKSKAEAEVAYRQDNPPVKIEIDLGLANAFVKAEEAYANRYAQPLAEPTPPPAKQEVVFVTDSKHQVGEEITDKHGRLYRVTKESYWLSQREADDLDDQDIFGVEPGWQTEARLAE